MLRNVVLKSLWDQRRSFVWWCVGLIAFVFMTIFFYPSFSEMPEINAVLGDEDSIMRAFVGDVSDMTSPEGYLNSQMYYIMMPLIFLIFAVVQGSGAIAGEEERGTLDLLLSNPLTRFQIMMHKFISMLVAIWGLAVVLWLGTLAAARMVEMDIGIMRLAEITLSVALLGALFGTMAMSLGGSTGKRGMSVAITSVIAVISYLLNALVPIEDSLEPFSKLSPFYYYIDADPLTNGLDLVHAVTLVALTGVVFLIGIITFEHRDLGIES